MQGKEESPLNILETREQGFMMRSKMGADHVSETANRRSRTGFLLLLHYSPIYWFLKK